ncbi:MAG: HD domain-containing protein [Ruminococcaceae bacterium]|nr:HD domain-containing protein [Oscillospiraceae bacterium]
MLSKNLMEFHGYVKDLALSDTVMQMDNYMQHGDITTLEHVIAVSYTAFILAKKWNADVRSAVRGAMLHDLYLYDWHIRTPERTPLTHTFNHPKTSVKNAKIYFEPTEKELKIVRSHMWPLTVFHMPTSKEAFILTLADKYCAWNESFGIYDKSEYRKKIKTYLVFIKKVRATRNLANRQF